MLKIRITFVDNEAGREELEEAKRKLENDFSIINESRAYKGRNNSLYSNLYLDVENK